MKGTIFKAPFEVQLVLENEGENAGRDKNQDEWIQGGSVQGRVTLKNRGSTQVSTALIVERALGQLKKVHQKADDAFEVLESISSPGAMTIAPGEEAGFEFKFALDSNCPITDAKSSLFLVVREGDSSPGEKKLSSDSARKIIGQLQLRVQPHPIIQEVLKTLQIQFRFVLKSLHSNKKAQVEVKFTPPSGQAYAAVDGLTAKFHFESDLESGLDKNQVLHSQLTFQTRTIAATASSLNVSKSTKDFKVIFKPEDYQTSTGRYHFEKVEARLKGVLSEVASKVEY